MQADCVCVPPADEPLVHAYQMECEHCGVAWLSATPTSACAHRTCAGAGLPIVAVPTDPRTIRAMALAHCAQCAAAGRACHVAVARTCATDTRMCKRCGAAMRLCTITANASIPAWRESGARCVAAYAAAKGGAMRLTLAELTRAMTVARDIGDMRVFLRAAAPALATAAADGVVALVAEHLPAQTPAAAALADDLWAEARGVCDAAASTCDFCIGNTVPLARRACSYYEHHATGRRTHGCVGGGCAGVMATCRDCRRAGRT
jgi:hypothetical protein